MTLQAQMRSFMERSEGTPHDLARAFLIEVGGEVDGLVSLLAEEFAHLRRAEARALELEAFAQRRQRDSGAIVPVWSPELRGTFCALGDGMPVEFGQMTVAQHRIRIAMLRKLAAGIERTVALHEQAVAEIETAGATCLNDLVASVA